MENININKYRKPAFKINPIFINRWSPRAMSGEKISDDELMSLFEAAKWAPSSYNNQHWRFIYAKRETANFEKLFNLLGEGNKIWCKNASVLLLIISKKTLDYNNQPAITHSFDTGSAWENLALQGSINNLVIHGMQGFDYEKAKQTFNIPDNYQVEAMAAIGKPGKTEDLPETLQKVEFPSSRKNLSEIISEGQFIWH